MKDDITAAWKDYTVSLQNKISDLHAAISKAREVDEEKQAELVLQKEKLEQAIAVSISLCLSRVVHCCCSLFCILSFSLRSVLSQYLSLPCPVCPMFFIRVHSG